MDKFDRKHKTFDISHSELRLKWMALMESIRLLIKTREDVLSAY
jgi:hypothetical protein